MSDLVAIAYPDLATAQQVATNLGEARKAHLIEIEDLVLVEHRTDAARHHDDHDDTGASPCPTG
jgi:uncharacterized membrane protein